MELIFQLSLGGSAGNEGLQPVDLGDRTSLDSTGVMKDKARIARECDLILDVTHSTLEIHIVSPAVKYAHEISTCLRRGLQNRGINLIKQDKFSQTQIAYNGKGLYRIPILIMNHYHAVLAVRYSLQYGCLACIPSAHDQDAEASTISNLRSETIVIGVGHCETCLVVLDKQVSRHRPTLSMPFRGT